MQVLIGIDFRPYAECEASHNALFYQGKRQGGLGRRQRGEGRASSEEKLDTRFICGADAPKAETGVRSDAGLGIDLRLTQAGEQPLKPALGGASRGGGGRGPRWGRGSEEGRGPQEGRGSEREERAESRHAQSGCLGGGHEAATAQ